MPFDTTTLHRPPVTILPPQPPERGGGGPQRIHIQIDIVDRRSQPGPRPRFGMLKLLLVLILLVMLFGCQAHAQPNDGSIHYDHFQDTNGWHGQTRTQGNTTDWDAYGPHGEQKHCHRYLVGDTAYTSCH
jgi:hypothetical protein